VKEINFYLDAVKMSDISIDEMLEVLKSSNNHYDVAMAIVETGKLSAEEMINLLPPEVECCYTGWYEVAEAVVKTNKLSFEEMIRVLDIAEGDYGITNAIVNIRSFSIKEKLEMLRKTNKIMETVGMFGRLQ